jgi:hypothetical protein
METNHKSGSTLSKSCRIQKLPYPKVAVSKSCRNCVIIGASPADGLCRADGYHRYHFGNLYAHHHRRITFDTFDTYLRRATKIEEK